MKQKICVITGTRADYGILYPVMKAIKASKDLELYVVATGMHLMPEFGYTLKEIEKDGFQVYKKVDSSYKEDTGEAMADSLGKTLSAFAKTFNSLKPSIVLVLGDRGEMLAAAVAANYLNIPVAHIHGGEVSGHVDGLLRHAITKLSHIHFPATEGSKKRIIKLGEESWRIFVAGAPALDRILNEKLPTAIELAKKYDIIKPSLGIYPLDAVGLGFKDDVIRDVEKIDVDKEIEFIRKNKDKIIAIGEIGLDNSAEDSRLEEQKIAFRKAIR